MYHFSRGIILLLSPSASFHSCNSMQVANTSGLHNSRHINLIKQERVKRKRERGGEGGSEVIVSISWFDFGRDSKLLIMRE